MPGTLYYGDNLDVLRRHIPDQSVDLVYLDPPFNSNANYNVLFAEHDGTRAAAQIRAFADTWRWDQAAAQSYEAVVEAGGQVSLAMQAFRTFLGTSDMLAYLAMMAPRLVELRRVLKPTGSLYLHCDPTASHYLKMLLDASFGPANGRSEIIWQRTSAHANVSAKYGAVHDTVLFYTVGATYTWNQQYTPYSEEYLQTFFDQQDENGRRYARRDLTASMAHASSGQNTTIVQGGPHVGRVYRPATHVLAFPSVVPDPGHGGTWDAVRKGKAAGLKLAVIGPDGSGRDRPA